MTKLFELKSLFLWAWVSTQVFLLPSPPNASEPKRVCVWGRRVGDEGEMMLV